MGKYEGQYFYVMELQKGEQKALAVDESRALNLVRKTLYTLHRTKEGIPVEEISHEVLMDEPRFKLIRGTSGKHEGSHYHVLKDKALFITPSLAKRFLAAVKKTISPRR